MAFIGIPEEGVEIDWFIRGPEKMAMSEYYCGDP
jgi:hypothetical protein